MLLRLTGVIAVFLSNGAEALLIVLIEVTALHAVARVFVVAVSFADFLAPDEVMLMLLRLLRLRTCLAWVLVWTWW